MLELMATALSAESFTEFGDVIETDRADFFSINNGRTRRYHDLAKVEILGSESRAVISIFVSQPVTLPLLIHSLERHPLGSQAFMPLHEERFLVVVAPPGNHIDPACVRAFVTDGRQGVNYRADTWHAVHSVLNQEGEFLVIDRGGPGNNCDELSFALRVTFEQPV